MLKTPAPLRTVALLGGSGFVGQALASRLQAAGFRTRILTRSLEHAKSLWLLPDAHCEAVDVHDRAALATALRGCEGLVNLIGILNEKGDSGRGFRRAHVETTVSALAAAEAAGVSRYAQVSALNANPEGPSHYLRSKGEAEQRVLEIRSMRTAIVRPSVIFGAGDGLFGRFLPLVTWLPFLPLAGAEARMQPVFVGDVAEAIVRILGNDHLASGSVFELGGPEVWTLGRLVEYTARSSGHSCPVIALPAWAGRLQAEVCEHLPGKPFSRDNWRSLKADSVVHGADGLTALGITATPLDNIVPALLKPSRRARDYSAERRGAHR
jgi:uncharacterized protein YbjT (DUF2867 family)